MDSGQEHYTGNIEEYAEALILQEYAQEEAHGVGLPHYQIEQNPGPTTLRHTMIEKSSTTDIDQGSGIAVQKGERITAKPILVNSGRVYPGPEMEGGHFERYPSGVHRHEPAVSLARLIESNGLSAGSWVLVEKYRAMNDPREVPPHTESRSFKFIKV